MDGHQERDRGPRGRPAPDTESTTRIVGRVTLPDGTVFLVTTHCVDRFWERAAVGCVRFRDALARLGVLCAQVGELRAPPGWVRGEVGDKVVALGPDVVLVVDRHKVVTCLTRGSLADEIRRSRNRKARRRRRARSKRRRGELRRAEG